MWTGGGARLDVDYKDWGDSLFKEKFAGHDEFLGSLNAKDEGDINDRLLGTLVLVEQLWESGGTSFAINDPRDASQKLLNKDVSQVLLTYWRDNSSETSKARESDRLKNGKYEPKCLEFLNNDSFSVIAANIKYIKGSKNQTKNVESRRGRNETSKADLVLGSGPNTEC